MNVASCDRRSLILIILLFCFNSAYSMILDNRYFPWIPHLHTGSDHSRPHLETEGFFITGGDAYRLESTSSSEEEIVSYPELWGELELAKVGQSMAQVGLSNPIPADWRWLSDFKVKMNGSLEGQGLMVGGYTPITSWFGVGGSAAMMRLNAVVTLTPHQETQSKLFLNSPGNQALFTQTLANIYDELCIKCTTFKEVGVGDVVLYCNFYDVQEYRYKLRKIDYGLQIGFIIPSGLKQDPTNLASIPVGGNGLTGWFIAPYVEAELKEDWIVGAQARVTQRFDKNIVTRVPVGQEQPLFAPLIGEVRVDAGTSFTAILYATFNDVRGGLGFQGKYTATYHEHDTFAASIPDSNLKPNFRCMNRRSEWTSSYGTVRVFYDLAHDKTWRYRPLISFAWDIPTNHLGGKAFAKTHRISLGCTVNF